MIYLKYDFFPYIKLHLFTDIILAKMYTVQSR